MPAAESARLAPHIIPGVNVEEAREQVRSALRRVFGIVGSQRKFTAELNARLAGEGQAPITFQAVNWWLSEGQFIDRRYWGHIEQISDMATTRRHLRPDLYGLAHP